MIGIDDCVFPVSESENAIRELEVNERDEILIREMVREPDSILKSEVLFDEEMKSNLRRENEVETVMTNEIS